MDSGSFFLGVIVGAGLLALIYFLSEIFLNKGIEYIESEGEEEKEVVL